VTRRIKIVLQTTSPVPGTVILETDSRSPKIQQAYR